MHQKLYPMYHSNYHKPNELQACPSYYSAEQAQQSAQVPNNKQTKYPPIMFSFDMGKKCGIAQIRFPTRTNIISIIGIISSSSTISLLIVVTLYGEHFQILVFGYYLVDIIMDSIFVIFLFIYCYWDGIMGICGIRFILMNLFGSIFLQVKIIQIYFLQIFGVVMIRSVVACTWRRISFYGFKLGRIQNVGLFSSVQSMRYNFSTKGTKMSEEELKKIKEQGREFYDNQVQKIIELKSSGQFQKLILGIADPIILDLYADWCEPCKKLTPRLQNKVNSLENVKLIKVNIDKCPEIAHALQVKSVPTVYLLYRGQAVDKIQGNVNQAEFNKFFDNIGKLTGTSQQHKQAIEILDQAKQLLAQRKPQLATQILQNFKQKKVPSDLIAIKQLLLTQCYLSLGKPTKFKDAIQRASQYQQFYKQVPDLQKFYLIMQEQVIKFQKQSKQDPTITNLQGKLAAAQTKQQRLNAKFQLVNYYKTKQLTQNALQTAMEIIKQDKQWQEKKTNKLVLAIFKELGNNSPLVQKYRKILQRVLS